MDYQHHSIDKRPSSVSLFWECSGKTGWSKGCWCPTISSPSRVCSLIPSQRGMLEAQTVTRSVINSLKDHCPLPSLEEITSSQSLRRTRFILSESSYHLFDLPPSERHYRSIKTLTSRLPWAIRTLNKKSGWSSVVHTATSKMYIRDAAIL